MADSSDHKGIRKPVIAVVGISNRPDRPSHDVSAYMQRQGYRIVAVNPQYAGQKILNEICFASLTEASQVLAGSGDKIGIVNCFRRAQDIPPVVDEAILIAASSVWMQQGIINEEAAAVARNAGLIVIMDRCIKVEHASGNSHGVLW